MSSFKDLASILDEHLYTLSNLPERVWENQEYTPEEDVLYFEAFIQPAESQNRFLGSDAPTYESGTYQINIVGVRGEGRTEVYDWVDSIVGHFTRGTILTNSGVDINVRIRSAFPRPAFYNNNGRFVVPVDIKYLCFMPK